MKRQERINRILSYFGTLLVAIFSLTPLYWIFITSLKPQGSEYLLPLQLFPKEITLQAYRAVIEEMGFLTNLQNSIVVALMSTIFIIFIAGLAAFAVARLRFKYAVESLLALQMGAMIPLVVTVAPIFVISRELGLLRSLSGMIFPYVFQFAPMSIWLLANYFAELPYELDDAAKMDGYKPLQIFRKVVLPLAAPGLFSAGIFAFLGTWGEFLLALVITGGAPSVQTIPVAIIEFSSEWRLQWTWVSAGIIMSLAPIVILVMLLQRWVIKGLTAGSVKY